MTNAVLMTTQMSLHRTRSRGLLRHGVPVLSVSGSTSTFQYQSCVRLVVVEDSQMLRSQRTNGDIVSVEPTMLGVAHDAQFLFSASRVTVVDIETGGYSVQACGARAGCAACCAPFPPEHVMCKTQAVVKIAEHSSQIAKTSAAINATSMAA